MKAAKKSDGVAIAVKRLKREGILGHEEWQVKLDCSSLAVFNMIV